MKKLVVVVACLFVVSFCFSASYQRLGAREMMDAWGGCSIGCDNGQCSEFNEACHQCLEDPPEYCKTVAESGNYRWCNPEKSGGCHLKDWFICATLYTCGSDETCTDCVGTGIGRDKTCTVD